MSFKKEENSKIEKAVYYKINKSILKNIPKNKQYFECIVEYKKTREFSINKFLRSIYTSVNTINDLKNIVYNVVLGFYQKISPDKENDDNINLLYCWVCLDNKLISYDLYCINNEKLDSSKVIRLVKDLGFTIYSRKLHQVPILPLKISISKKKEE